MGKSQNIKLLLYDTNYFYHRDWYKTMSAKGADLTRIWAPSELESVDLVQEVK